MEDKSSRPAEPANFATNPAASLARSRTFVSRFFERADKRGRAWPVAIGALVVLLLLPLRIGTFGEFVLQIGFIYVIVALGLHVLVHWAGQISFGHIAFAALGAHVAARLGAGGLPFWLTIPLGVLACLAAGLLVGIPALRIRGFHLAIVTFAFGYTADRWLFRQAWLTGASEGLGGNEVARPSLFGVTLSDAGLYTLILLVLVAVMLALVRLRRTKGGRALKAVRDSEELAASFGINVAAYKIFAFMISSAVAGLGGGLWAYALRAVDDTAFPIGLSILFVSLVVIGGAGPIWGTATVALSFGVIPPILGQGPAKWFDLIGPLGLLLVILQYPGGQNQAGREMARQAWAVAARFRSRRAPGHALPSPAVVVQAPRRSAVPRRAADARDGGTSPNGVGALDIKDLSIRFGGLQALQGVNLTARAGEVTGLIGPNGAGKSTILNCISGFLRPQTGRVWFFGDDLSARPSHQRAKMGLGRTFQQLAVCPEETVLENLLIAQHRLTSYGALGGIFGRPGVAAAGSRLKESAEEMLDLLGLGAVADRAVRNVPLGTAKLVELACVLVCAPRVLLLDEPTGGLSHEETQRVRQVLLDLRKHQRLSILLVAHDMRLIMGLSDHVYVLNFGQILAQGSPAEIRRDAAVVEAYLGMGASTKVAGASRR